MSQVFYFQLGGSSQIKWTRTQSLWDDTALAELVAGASSPLRQKNSNGNVELVLGLKSSGSSHLLLTADDARDISSHTRLPLPSISHASRAHDFESLSLIVFKDVDQLKTKLRSLKLKKGGISQANRNYQDSNHDPYRASFEHGRLLYQILHTTADLRRFGVEDISWVKKIRVVSFVFNVKGLDYRHSEQKRLYPEVLDIGFCEAHLPAVAPDYSTAKHFLNGRNKMLGRNQPKMPFNYGVTEELAQAELSQRLRELFADHQGIKSENPIILLVSKEKETMNYLRNMGVDTSGWRSGIKDLIMPDTGKQRESSSPRRHGGSSHSRESSFSGNPHSPNHYRHRHQPRSRSRSPERRQSNQDRRQDYSQYYASSSSTSRTANSGDMIATPPSREPFAPVYVLDVRELYVKLMQMNNADGVADIARLFQMTEEEGWCAGNESAIIIDVWRQMVSSDPIDEQRVIRMAALSSDPSVDIPGPDSSTPAPEPQPYVYDSDEERDPNDIPIIPQTQIMKAQKAVKNDDPYDFDESDHSSDDD